MNPTDLVTGDCVESMDGRESIWWELEAIVEETENECHDGVGVFHVEFE